MPPAIAFLERHGVPAARLREAARLARTLGVPAEEALLRHDLMTERDFYRALAAELRLPFLEGDLAVDPVARFPESVGFGVARVAAVLGEGWAMAPKGDDVARLLTAGRPSEPGLALTTPTALREGVIKALGPVIAGEAADFLARTRPGWSFKGGPSLAQWLAGTLILAGLVGVALGAAEGAVGALSLTLSLLFLGMIIVRLSACLEHAPTTERLPARPLGDRALPTYTILVALHREAAVVQQLVEALSELDYPRAKLDVKLVIEEDDHDTAYALSHLALPGHFEVVVAPPGRPRTKPRALNVALPLARGEYLAVYDAEDVPDRDQLRLAAERFERLPKVVACLQGRLVIDNTADDWLSRLFAIEYAGLFDVINPGLARQGHPVPLGGTSTHFRTETLRGLGGWDAWNVTEDADLGIRIALAGYRVADLPSSTLEESPPGPVAWLKQRTRWMKGFMQVCITHSRHPAAGLRSLGPYRFFVAVTMSFGTVAAALGYPFFTALTLSRLAEGTWLEPRTLFAVVEATIGLTVLAFGLLAACLPALIGIARRRWWELLPWVLLLPAYYVLISLAAWCGLIELLTAPFRWNKTEHGLARTSRSGRLMGRPRSRRRRSLREPSGAPQPLPREGGPG